MSGERVCIIFSPEFGFRLDALDKTAPIWIIQSPTNNPIIAELRKSKSVNISSFVPQAFDELIETVDEHHPRWGQLELYGLSVQDAAAAIQGFNGTLSAMSDGFYSRKNNSRADESRMALT